MNGIFTVRLIMNNELGKDDLKCSSHISAPRKNLYSVAFSL